MAKCHRVFVWLTLISVLLGCNGNPPNPSKNKLREKPLVVTTSYPLKYFADRIAGKKIDVTYPPEAIDGCLHVLDWQPSASAVLEMQKADRVITNGSGFERWLPLVPLRESSIVDTSEFIQSELLEIDGKPVHQHGPEGAKTKNALAFATWLNPELAISQAQVVKQTMINLMPSEGDYFEENFKRLKTDLENLNESLKQPATPIHNETWLAAQPIYQYLGQALQIPIRDLNWKNTDHIDNTRWAALDAAIAEQPAQRVLWDGEITDQAKRNFQTRDIDVLQFPTLMDPPVSGDYLSHMQDSIQRLRSPALK